MYFLSYFYFFLFLKFNIEEVNQILLYELTGAGGSTFIVNYYDWKLNSF